MTDTYRHLPEPDLDRLQKAFIARDAEVLGRLLVAAALNTRDNSIVLETALRSLSEVDDTFVVASALEAISHVHWFGSGRLLDERRLDAALSNVPAAVLDEPLVQIKLKMLRNILIEKVVGG
jgi:hypothetical protein